MKLQESNTGIVTSVSNKVKSLLGIKVKHPTLKADYAAYSDGAGSTFSVDYNEFLQQVETIERIIRIHANIFSLMIPRTYKEDSKGELKPFKVKNIDFDFINEADTRVDFLRKLAVSIYTQGAGLIVGEQSKGMVQLYTINMANVTINTSPTKIIDSFVYKGSDGSELKYKLKDVMYINDSIDPSNLIYSLSRLKSLNDIIQMQAAIVAKAKNTATGGAKDAFIISADQPMSAEVQNIIKDRFDKFMTSTNSSSLLLNTKLSIHQVGNNMTASDMLSFFKEVNKLMIEHFNVPPSLLGSYGLNGANKNEELIYSLRVWFTTMIRPVMTNIELAFTRYFRDTLGLKGVVFKFDLADVDMLDDPIDVKVDRAIRLSKAGIMSFNEARHLAELKPIDHESADLHFLPQYLTGSAPISIENFDAEVERLLQGASMESTDSDIRPSGSSGDEDNTNLISESRGGEQGDKE